MHHQYFVVAPLLSFLAPVIAQENPFACESCLTTSTLGIASNAVVEHSSAIPAFSHDVSLAHRKAKSPKPKVSLTTPVEATETIAHAPLKSTATKAIAILTSTKGIATGSIAIPTPSMGKDGHEDSATVTSTTTTADPTGSDKQPIEPTWKPKWWGGDHSLKLLGCYNETDEEGEFVMTSKYGGDSAKKGGMNLGTCRQHCKAVKYFGVSNGDDCICADYFKSSMYKVNGTLCNFRCIGVGEYACGGNGYMNIYQKTTMKNDLNSMTNSSTNNLVDLDWTFFFGVLFMTFYLTSLRRNW